MNDMNNASIPATSASAPTAAGAAGTPTSILTTLAATGATAAPAPASAPAAATSASMPTAGGKALDVVSLYPKDMNIYGDSGNVLTIRRRIELRGYVPRIHQINQGDPWPAQVDLILGGGGQDTGQKKIVDDLFVRADMLRALADEGMPMLMICGMYQLFGEYFEAIGGTRMEGIGVIDAHTVGQSTRMIGNIVTHSDDFGDLIGYENHSGQTFLGEGVQPFGRLAAADAQGRGNNGEDGTEGARVHNVIGTYLHGSLLPKNPRVADFLIRTAVERRYGEAEVAAFDAAGAASAELRRLDDIIANARRTAAARPR